MPSTAETTQPDTAVRGGSASPGRELRERVERRLDALAPESADDALRLESAMRYSLLAPGKRMRPVLLLLIAEAAGGARDALLDVACAVEMVHTASLVLDDLPSMDDAALRRGRETTHRRFGEALSILAAVSLLTRGFELVAGSDALTPSARNAITLALGRAVGSQGLSAGQEIDIAGGAMIAAHREGRGGLDMAAVSRSHALKTGALFTATVDAAALGAGVGDLDRGHLTAFSRHLGLAFQALDDLMDLAPEAEIGKDAGRDGERPSIVTLFGEREARAQFRRRMGEAHAALAQVSFDTNAVRLYVDAMLRGV